MATGLIDGIVGTPIGALALWMIAIVFTLGFAAIPFQLWLAKLILDNWEIEEHEK